MLFVNGDGPAVFADEFSVFHQLFILLQFVFQKADVVQEAKMSLMARMGHMKISHGYHPLSLAVGGKRSNNEYDSACSREEIFLIV